MGNIRKIVTKYYRLFYLILAGFILGGWLTPPCFADPEVLVLKRALRPGDVLTAQDLEWETAPRIPSGAVQNPKDIIGKSAKSHLPAGLVMYPQLFETAKVVQQGQTVEVILRSETMDIRYTGIATQDGGRGQIITIRMPSGTLIGATVLDPGKVVVQE